jgi:hypothetical protein
MMCLIKHRMRLHGVVLSSARGHYFATWSVNPLVYSCILSPQNVHICIKWLKIIVTVPVRFTISVIQYINCFRLSFGGARAVAMLVLLVVWNYELPRYPGAGFTKNVRSICACACSRSVNTHSTLRPVGCPLKWKWPVSLAFIPCDYTNMAVAVVYYLDNRCRKRVRKCYDNFQPLK